MRKKSSYKPKGVRLDNMSFVKSGIKLFTDVPYGVTLRIRNHDAVNNLRLGKASRNDIDILIGALNITEGFGRIGKGADWAEEIRQGQDALLTIARRGVANKDKFIATGLELKAINLAMEVHDAQLDNCTVQELEQAMDVVKSEIAHKRARAIKEKA